MKMKNKPDNKKQSAQFFETAERIKADNDKKKFEKAIKKIIKTKKSVK